ncbi:MULTISPECIES: inorganic phosphate transporter [unclassified Porphyromonas]|uniref:inorganic phosphate transporter n=1 Tax=unclassified Porphyromonas TaxID=2645799 RepID=UPI00052D1143|nr:MULTISPECIES: inorganic phosphate transporter [unclassified Porphyromonas]KGN84320.1 phosphate transporter family protein [Porphyromonas sp. COT-290 OH860]KGN97652.1 phosphate transporter family protein [Porphyromonas sp. COT-290 OH3588]
MDLIFTCILIFLAVLAIIDLVVGVSNDAVNFLNSAIGAKAAPFKVVLGVAAVGVFLGASLSNGMMDIARNGIYHPEYFTFEEVMIICLTAMVTDVILLNIFNSLGLPTSTTVSMIFNLLGGAFCMSMLKIGQDPSLQLTELINTSKALQVIIAIFMSVAVAFFFGTVVQYFTRLIFTFNYKKNLPYFAGIFGGIAITSIIYFMLIKGLKDAAFMTADAKAWVSENTLMLLGIIFAASALIMQVLHWIGLNIFKIIILAGTLALSLAFAGNDLVNFIGIPLAGLSAYTDYMANGNGAYDTYLMGANNLPASTPVYYLLGSGLVMVLALVFSKSAQNVIKTSVNLSRQDDAEESFGTSKISRGLVRASSSTAQLVHNILPPAATRWINSRFNKSEIILEQGAAFDLVRASVNLVLAGLLIAVGTSLKLPLSTTYVTFMVAMGTSLADRAWGRESAVGRLTGVMGVIGGWFVTAAAAFTIAAIVSLTMFYGGFVAMIALIALAVFLLFSSRLFKKKSEASDELFVEILNSENEAQTWELLSKHVRLNQIAHLDNVTTDYQNLTNGFLNEDLKMLGKVQYRTEENKRRFKSMRRKETIGLRRLKNDAVLEKNMWFHLGANACLQMSYAIERSAEVCHEHVSNNFNPMPAQYREEFLPVRDEVIDYIGQVHLLISSEKMEDAKKAKAMGKELRNKVKEMRKTQMKRTHKSDKENLKVSLVYMNILQETNEILNNLRHLVSYSQQLLESKDEL